MVIRDAKVKAVPPLHVACRDRDVDTVLRLISLDDSGTVVEGSVDVNEKDDGSGWTALHFAAVSGDIEIVRHLLGAKANVRVTDSPYYQTPLHISSKYGHAGICRMLVLAGSDVNALTLAGNSPFDLASNEETKAVLLDGGAVAEKQGGGLKTPLEHDDTYKEMTGDYSGRMLHGRPHGQGQLTCDSGDVIVGQFAFGLPHGIAKRAFPDGSTYEGNWDRGSMSGSGTLQQANGDRYDGMWFRGLRSSSGTQTWARPPTASGSATVRYDGQWAEDMMHGEGTLYQKDGSYYKGAFASGQMSGHGKQVTVVNGVETESFEGSFLRGQRHNEGLDHRVGKSDTRLWYNHGRLLRRQVLCRLPHHHALIITVSTSSRPSQPPGASFRLPASIFQATLTRDSTAGYATEHVHCLTDEQATSKNIRRAFADISAEAGAGCSLLVVFDMPTVEIQGGPEAGFYFCPHDYSNADRRGSGLHTDEIVDWAGSLRSESCSMFVSTVYIGAKLDSDAQVDSFSTQMRVLGCSPLWQPTAPYFRQGMMERLNAIPIVTAVFPCGEEEIAYSGVMTTALHNILRGHRRRDDDELVPVRLPQGDLLLFDVVNAIKRQVTAAMPAEHKRDPRRHPVMACKDGLNNVLLRRQPESCDSAGHLLPALHESY